MLPHSRRGRCDSRFSIEQVTGVAWCVSGVDVGIRFMMFGHASPPQSSAVPTSPPVEVLPSPDETSGP
jgi:hypothetical protein